MCCSTKLALILAALAAACLTASAQEGTCVAGEEGTCENASETKYATFETGCKQLLDGLNWKIYEGNDLVDGDTNKVDRLEDCCFKCHQDPRCVHWVFNPESHACWMKSKMEGVPQLSPTEISGEPVRAGETVPEFHMMHNIIIYGNDMIDGTKNLVPSVEACYQSCVQHIREGCVAWTYKPSSRACWLKHSIGDNTDNMRWRESDDRISGHVAARGYSAKKDYDYPGHDLVDGLQNRKDSPAECFEACDREERCVAWSFDTASGGCWLKHTVAKGRQLPDFIAGIHNERIAKRFAPLMVFDNTDMSGDQPPTNFPSDAQLYYQKSCHDSSCVPPISSFTNTNQNFPTYYSVSQCGRQLRIRYWWFYDMQWPCFADRGSHTGDWENILVLASEDQKKVAAVRFTQHNGDYLRKHEDNFELINVTHPVVYVGRFSHGSYHNKLETNTLTKVGTVRYCTYFGDARTPGRRYPAENWLVNMLDFRPASWITRTRAIWGLRWGLKENRSPSFTLDKMTARCDEKSCRGHNFIDETVAIADSGCTQSSCLKGYERRLDKCLKCPSGYVDCGHECTRGNDILDCLDPFDLGRGRSHHEMDLDFVIPTEDSGLMFEA